MRISEIINQLCDNIYEFDNHEYTGVTTIDNKIVDEEPVTNHFPIQPIQPLHQVTQQNPLAAKSIGSSSTISAGLMSKHAMRSL